MTEERKVICTNCKQMVEITIQGYRAFHGSQRFKTCPGSGVMICKLRTCNKPTLGRVGGYCSRQCEKDAYSDG